MHLQICIVNFVGVATDRTNRTTDKLTEYYYHVLKDLEHNNNNNNIMDLQILIMNFVRVATAGEFNLSITRVGCHGKTSVIQFYIHVCRNRSALLIFINCTFS